MMDWRYGQLSQPRVSDRFMSPYHIRAKITGGESSATVPYSVAMITGRTTSEGEEILTLDMPNDDGLPASSLVLLPPSMYSDGDYLDVAMLPNFPLPLALDDTDGTPSFGQSVGTITDSWKVGVGRTGFTTIWYDSTNGLVHVVATTGKGKYDNPGSIGTSDEAEAAYADTWDRDDASIDSSEVFSGLDFTMITRFAYDPSGDATLYAYYRTLSFDDLGMLKSISEEGRVTIEVPEAC